MSWTHVRGHDAIREQFDFARRRGRLGQAYLFVGPEGVGKRLFARELAKALLCETQAERLEACDRCAACKLCDAGTHPDLHLAARPEDMTELPIEVVRGVSDFLSLKAARSGHKVAVIDDADDLNIASANSFLKTLEEPPPMSVLILVGTSAESQLPTVVSRCQVVHFRPLAPRDLRQVLIDRGLEDPLHRDRLAQLAAGSPGLALQLDDEALWEFRRKVLADLAKPDLDAAALAARWLDFAAEAGKEGAAQRRRAAQALRLLIDTFEQALRLASGVPARDADAADRAALEALAARLGPDGLLAWLDHALAMDMHLDRKVQLALAVEAFADALGHSTGGVTR